MSKKTIHKYAIPAKATFEMCIPNAAIILRVATQHGVPVMWVLLDDNAPKSTWRFYIVGTGSDCTKVADINNYRYVGTWLEQADQLVWHLFLEL